MGSGASSKSVACADKHKEVLDRVAESHEFYFVCADRLRELAIEDGKTLPFHQELMRKPGWVVKRRVVFYTLLMGGYEDMAIASHRWERPRQPDPKNQQLRKIQAFLQENLHIKMVWLDFASIPQGDRDDAHEKYFRETLKHISLLYLSLPVIIIYDVEYRSRFWCNYEVYLSLRQHGKDISAAGDTTASRFFFYCVGSAKHNPDIHKQSVIADWRDTRIATAVEMLREDDIQVTNRRDKEEQLQNLKGLEGRVKSILEQGAQLVLEEEERQKADIPCKVRQFLDEADLASWADTFFDSGVDSMKILVELGEDDLKELGLKIGHRKKFFTKLIEWQNSAEAVTMPTDIAVARSMTEAAVEVRDTVWSTTNAFFARLQNDKVLAWGSPGYGGDIRKVQAELESGKVDAVWSTGRAFFARLQNDTVLAWGSPIYGGDITKVQAELESGKVDAVWSTAGAFFARLQNDKVLAWGDPDSGGDIRKVQAELESGKV